MFGCNATPSSVCPSARRVISGEVGSILRNFSGLFPCILDRIGNTTSVVPDDWNWSPPDDVIDERGRGKACSSGTTALVIWSKQLADVVLVSYATRETLSRARLPRLQGVMTADFSGWHPQKTPWQTIIQQKVLRRRAKIINKRERARRERDA